MERKDVKLGVRKAYGSIAKARTQGCSSSTPGCGGVNVAEEISRKIGYADEDLQHVPEGANLGLGCGNPVALGSLKEGETVLDLGSGGGLDVFLAAQEVGESGRVIGVDMTPEMIDRARNNVKRRHVDNVEFRLGEIEHLPLTDNTVDVVISNCVINLSTDKPQVFREAFRVLRPGGRLIISDTVLLKDLPDSVRQSVAAYTGCLGGALLKDEYLATIREAGFHDVRVVKQASLGLDCFGNDPTVKAVLKESALSPKELAEVAASIASITLSAFKPKAT